MPSCPIKMHTAHSSSNDLAVSPTEYVSPNQPHTWYTLLGIVFWPCAAVSHSTGTGHDADVIGMALSLWKLDSLVLVTAGLQLHKQQGSVVSTNLLELLFDRSLYCRQVPLLRSNACEGPRHSMQGGSLSHGACPSTLT